MATVTGAKGVQAHCPGYDPENASKADWVTVPSLPWISTSRSAPMPPIEYPLNVLLSMSRKIRITSSPRAGGRLSGPIYTLTERPAEGAGKVFGIVVLSQ